MDTKQIQFIIGVILFSPCIITTPFTIWAIINKTISKFGWYFKLSPIIMVIGCYLMAVATLALKEERSQERHEIHEEWCEAMGYDFSYELWEDLGESGREGHYSFEPSRLPKKVRNK